MTETTSGLSTEAADLFARGLFYLANVDGIDSKEEELLRDFIKESGSTLGFDELKADASFSMHEAAMVLETSFHRRMFITAAIAMIKADGEFSTAERHALGEIADAFGLSNAEFGDLEQEASRASLE
jgi:tellurite resistance protein